MKTWSTGLTLKCEAHSSRCRSRRQAHHKAGRSTCLTCQGLVLDSANHSISISISISVSINLTTCPSILRCVPNMSVCPSVWQLSTCSRLPIIDTCQVSTLSCFFWLVSIMRTDLEAVLEESSVSKPGKQELKPLRTLRVLFAALTNALQHFHFVLTSDH